MTRIPLKGLSVFLIFFFAASSVWSANFADPERPDVDFVFNAARETRIIEIAGLPSDEAFQKLKEMDFATDDAFLSRAVFKVFEKRKAEGIVLALRSLKAPVFETTNGRFTSRMDDFHVARRILEVFPEDAATGLRELYEKGNAVTRGNVVRASGRLAGGSAIADLLIRALDDKDICERETDETEGIQLRVCDVAYNQLVLRYKIRNVLRTIGTPHSIKARDYHIAELKKLLQDKISE